MRLRIRLPDLDSAQRAALERRARLVLGRHAAAIARVDLTISSRSALGLEHSDCVVIARLVGGGEVRVQDDGRESHRALLRAAWRIEQRCELARLRSLGDPHSALREADRRNP